MTICFQEALWVVSNLLASSSLTAATAEWQIMINAIKLVSGQMLGTLIPIICISYLSLTIYDYI